MSAESGKHLSGEVRLRDSARPEVSVIVPTYREAANLPLLVPRIARALEPSGIAWEVLIVDDDSRDGTQETCEELEKTYPLRILVRRGERGLASAVLRGMEEASGEIFVVMDADLSHPPEKIPELLGALADPNVDVAVGSRYSAGGGTEGDWGFLRRLNSRVATLLARPLTACRDPMAGFFAIRRSSVERAGPLEPIGFKILLELLVKARCQRIAEVPIFFASRKLGKSKLSVREQINYLRHLERLYAFRLGPYARLARFLMVGASGMLVDLIAFFLLLRIVGLSLSVALAIWLAMTWNFFWNRAWTFRDSRPRPLLLQYVLFCASCLLGGALNYGISVALITHLETFRRWKLAARLCGIAAGTAFNYTLSALVVFRPEAVPRNRGGPRRRMENRCRSERGPDGQEQPAA